MNKKKMLIGCCIGLLALNILMPIDASAQESEVYGMTGANVITPRATQYEWRYKIENGKKYRRLWDATNEKWLTDWILC